MSYCQHIAVTWIKNAGAPEAQPAKGQLFAQSNTGTAPKLRLMV